MSTENGRTPDVIRHDIEQTREQLAQTAAVLAERADVKARAHDKVEETKARITGKVQTARAKVTGTGPGTAGAPNSAQAAAGGLADKAKENPVPTAALGGVVAGFLLGWVIAARRCSP